MNIIKKLAGDTAIYGIPSIVGRFIGFILIFFYTGYFTPDLLAPQIEFYTYAAFFFVVLPHGMETAFFNFSRKNEDYKDVYATALVSLIIVVLTFIFLMTSNKAAIGNFTGYSDHLNYIVLFIILLSVDVCKTLPYALLRYLDKPKLFAIIKTIGIILNVSLNIFFVVFYPKMTGGELSIENVFVANIIASVSELLLLSFFTVKHIGKPNLDLWKQMFIYSWPLMILGFAGVVNETFDRIALRKLLPEDTVDYQIGVYGAFYKLSMLMTIFIQAFRYAVEPFFFAQANQKDAKSSYIQIMDWFVFVCGGIFLVVSLFKSEIAHLFIRKPEFHQHPDALFIIPVLLLANLFLGIFFNLSIWYKLNNKTKLGALVSVVGAIVTLVLLYIYVPIYGFKAAAITTLIAYIVITILSYILGQKYYPVDYHIFMNLGTIGLAVVLYLVSEKLELSTPISYAVSLGLILLYTLIGHRLILTKGKKLNLPSKMIVTVINKSNNELPEYQTKQSAGVDLRAFLEKDMVLKPMERKLIATGLYIALPDGFEAQIRPRSGLAFKHGITVINSPGTIDADYRGELKIALHNLSNEDFVVSNGDRIAQMVVSKFEQVAFQLVDSLDVTERGAGGYGHTGI